MYKNLPHKFKVWKRARRIRKYRRHRITSVYCYTYGGYIKVWDEKLGDLETVAKENERLKSELVSSADLMFDCGLPDLVSQARNIYYQLGMETPDAK